MSGNSMASDADGSTQTVSALTAHLSLVTDLENAIALGSPKRRAAMLLHVTDLFIRGSDQFTENEIDLFDEVFTRLASGIDVTLRLLLAENLAFVANAPRKITRMLANDEDIKVSYPILVHSTRLDDVEIASIVRTKGQAHLLAVSRRKSVTEAVTEELVERGNKQVLASVMANPGARFSHAGFTLLAEHSHGDAVLADNLQVKRQYSLVEPCFLFGGNEVPQLAV